MESKSHRFLVHFIKKFKLLDFCVPEFESLASLYGASTDKLFEETKSSLNIRFNPLVYVNLPSRDIAKKVVDRSILIKEIIDVISEAKTYPQLLENVDKDKLYPLLESGKSFKFNIEGIGRKIAVKEQIDIIESFGIFPFQQQIDLKNPDMIFKIVENQEDKRIYFGLEIASNRVEEDTFHHKYDLKMRPYLGPTSTDHQLAFLMANQGQIQPGDFVYDPFVGTGSIAVACSHFGAVQFGSDLDIRVLKGYGVGHPNKNKIEGLDLSHRFDIFTNFRHYQIA